MSKNIQIQVPCKGNNTRTVTGQVAWFQIGSQKFKFFIQSDGLRGVQLTHFASGLTVANAATLSSIRIASMHGGTVVTDREACRQALGKIEKKHGLGKFIAQLSHVDVINK